MVQKVRESHLKTFEEGPKEGSIHLDVNCYCERNERTPSPKTPPTKLILAKASFEREP